MNRPNPASHFEPDVPFDENPEWTDEDFANALPADEMLPPHVAAALVGGPAQAEITLELDSDVIAKFRATGEGWQARINEALKAASV